MQSLISIFNKHPVYASTCKVAGIIVQNKEQEEQKPCFRWACVLVERI